MSSFFQSDEEYCSSLLRNIWLAWKVTLPCAAALLKAFLFKKVAPVCPDECKDALKRDGFEYVFECARRVIEGAGLVSGGGLGVCGRRTRFPINLEGCQDFQSGFTWENWFRKIIGDAQDLAFGLGDMDWSISGLCTVTCGAQASSPIGCCTCNAACGWDLIISDKYEFCSTNPPNITRRGPLWCACLLEKKGIGRVYSYTCRFEQFGLAFGPYTVCCNTSRGPVVYAPCKTSSLLGQPMQGPSSRCPQWNQR